MACILDLRSLFDLFSFFNRSVSLYSELFASWTILEMRLRLEQGDYVKASPFYHNDSENSPVEELVYYLLFLLVWTDNPD